MTTQREFWNDYAGPGWAEHADALEGINQPVGRPALDAAGLRPGMRVLDVGCGTGGSARAIAAAVGPAGRVVGIDLSEPMIEVARRQVPEAEFVLGDVGNFVATEPFDVAYSRMCLMLLEDPIKGCTSILRALRPGGRLSATVFRDMASNPWLPAVVLGAAPHVGPLPAMPLPGEPGPFAFAESSVARAVLGAAGFVRVEVTAVDVVARPPGAIEEVAEVLIALGPAGGAYRRSAPEARAAARRGTAGLLRAYTSEGGLALPCGTWLITAERPR